MNSSKPKLPKLYRVDRLRKYLNLPQNANSSELDDKLRATNCFIEKFQTIEKTFSFIIYFVTMQYLYMSESAAN